MCRSSPQLRDLSNICPVIQISEALVESFLGEDLLSLNLEMFVLSSKLKLNFFNML